MATTHELPTFLEATVPVELISHVLQSCLEGKSVFLTCETRLFYMRAGTILPLGPVMQHVDEKLYDPLTIELYAPRSKSCHVIHDELNSNTQIEYKTDSLSLTVHTNTTPGKIELIVNSMSDKLTHVNGKPKRLQTVSDGIKIDLNRKEPNEVIVLTRGSASQ